MITVSLISTRYIVQQQQIAKHKVGTWISIFEVLLQAQKKLQFSFVFRGI